MSKETTWSRAKGRAKKGKYDSQRTNRVGTCYISLEKSLAGKLANPGGGGVTQSQLGEATVGWESKEAV